MAHVLTDEEKETQRLQKQWSISRLVVPEHDVVYTARLNGVPSSNDMTAQISMDNESGTLSDVLPDMTLLVGTTAGGYDLGMCRIRKTPITGTIYVGETSEIVWVDNAYLTIVSDYQLWAKPLRIVGTTPYMDWDIAYSDQHEDFDPVPMMGSDKVAKLTGSEVEVVLGPSADTPAYVIDSTISSRLWTAEGPASVTFDDDTAVNPVGTFALTGTYRLYCQFTAANGKSYTGVRYVVIYNDDDPHLTNFQIRNGRMNMETGSFSFEVVLFNQFSTTSLRKRSKIILCTEDYAEFETVTLPGQLPGAENILGIGWVTDIDTTRQSQFGEISFIVESAEFWMKKIKDYPSGLELKIGTAAAWTDMPGLNVQRACWHFLHWRSTATRMMDVSIEADGRYATRFNVIRANLWDRVIQVIATTIHGIMGVDNFGRLFICIEPQMVPVGDRTWPVVMTLTDDDLEGEISWKRRDVQAISMLDYSGVYISPSGGPSSFFAKSPGHSYAHYGEEEAQDNYLVESQAQTIEACGLYYGWRNNELDDLQVSFIHSMRVLSCWPRQYVHFTVSAQNDPRGIGFDYDFIVRELSFDQNVDTGFVAYRALLEPASTPGPAVKTTVPGMENIDFSIPSLPSLPGLPSLPSLPLISIPPTEENPNQPRQVILASDTHGVWYTQNFHEESSLIKWFSMNNGLSSSERLEIAQMVITPSGAIYCMTDGDSTVGWGKIMRASGLGGVWVTVFEATTYSPTARISGLGVNPLKSDEIAIVVGDAYVSFGSLDTHKIYVGSNTSYSAGGFARLKFKHTLKGVVFWKNNWIVVGHRPTGIGGSLASPRYWQFDSAGSLAGNADGVQWGTGAGATTGACHAISSVNLILWGANTTSDYSIVADLAGASITNVLDGIHVLGYQGMAISPTNVYALGHDGSTPYKSSDSLASWSLLSGTIPIGSDIWESCKDDYRFIFGGGIIIRLTMDQGATYEEKVGDLTTQAPLIDINLIRYISS
jgi:hypothetical protein